MSVADARGRAKQLRAEYLDALEEAGVCTACEARPRSNGFATCDHCRERNRRRLRRIQGYVGRRRCSVCRELGHERGACPRRKR